MGTRLFLSLLLLLSCFYAAPAEAAGRVALVVGNSDYQSLPKLPNPRNDAGDIAALLEDLDFEVIEAVDADLAAMHGAIMRFREAAQGAEVAIMFYAGHGIQVNGSNYLLPTSAELRQEVDLFTQTIPSDMVLRIMDQSEAQVRIVILDACRNNPLPDSMARKLGASGGLARPITAAGIIIAFATEPGNVASDGVGRNSPFTAALLEHLATPGLEIRKAFTRVRTVVLNETDRRQRPFLSDGLAGDFYLSRSDPNASSEFANKARLGGRIGREQLGGAGGFGGGGFGGDKGPAGGGGGGGGGEGPSH